MTDTEQNTALLGLTVQIVSAHVKNNQVPTQDLPALIGQVYTALTRAGAEPAVAEKQLPVVPAKRSIFPDYIICLEDGRKLKTLKRHLRSEFNMTPEQYREKWDLPPDYPMVAPSYAQHRSALAKQLGLGRKPAAAVATAPAATVPGAVAKEPAALPEPLRNTGTRDNGARDGGARDSGARDLARRESPARKTSGENTSGERNVTEPILVRDATPRDSKELDLKDREPRRSEHTAASVFSKFPKGQAEDVVQPIPEAPKKHGRKPFSKQLARNMRS